QQIADILSANNFTDLSAISIVGHGAAGQLDLGSTVLDDSTLSQHAEALKQIGQALTPGGDLQLYGCDVASGASGQQFVADLSQYVGGADVAAATHLVGSAQLGGNWNLDVNTRSCQVSNPYTPATTANYSALLANPTLTAAQSTVLTTDLDSDSVIDPGETVTTTVTITNTSAINATGVSFNETLTGMTLVNGTIKVTPIAFDDTYNNIVGNTPITFNAANGVLANDIDPDGPGGNSGLTAINIVQSDAVTHGTVVLNSDGSFTYTPDTGFAGTATFQYTAHDVQNLNSVITGTVTLNVLDPVWYVDSSASAAGADGSFNHPFLSVGAAAT